MIDSIRDWATWALGLIRDWLLSPAAWTQGALLIAAWIAAVLLTRALRPRLTALLSPPDDSARLIDKARRFVLIFLPLLLPLIAFLLTAAGEGAVTAMFGSGPVIAFGKGVFLFLAGRILVREVLTDPFLRFLGRFILLPILALYAVGLLTPATEFLSATMVQVGNIQFSVMAVVRGIIAGSLLFRLALWLNDLTAGYIGRQPLRPALRQLALKAAEITIYGIVFLVLMNVMGINMSTLAVLGGAIGVGLGFGLQKIASNFISGVILLVEGQATVGDFVRMNGGEAGRIVKMGARATILETADGRWIVVPNEDFITTRVINYSDAGSANRFEVTFHVPPDTDLRRVSPLILAAVGGLESILKDPAPECVLKAFGDGGADFAVTFWAVGLDEGERRRSSEVLFAIWDALRSAGIGVPAGAVAPA